MNDSFVWKVRGRFRGDPASVAWRDGAEFDNEAFKAALLASIQKASASGNGWLRLLNMIVPATIQNPLAVFWLAQQMLDDATVAGEPPRIESVPGRIY